MDYSQRLLKNENIEIDLSMVYDICDNNQVNIEKLVFTFLKSIPNILSGFDKYFFAKNFGELYKTAHSAKSSLSVFKVTGLYELIILIENSAKSENFEDLKSLVSSAKSKYLEVEDILKKHFKNINTQGDTSTGIIGES